MPFVVPFPLDASQPPFVENITVYTNDDNKVIVRVTGLAIADVPSTAALTAKINASDSDTASTTVQKLISQTLSAAGQIVNVGPGVWDLIFPLSPGDEQTLLTPHSYDVLFWVNLAGAPSTTRRHLQTGSIIAIQSVTALQATVSVTVTPSPASVNIGQTTQLTATPRDYFGNVLTGKVAAWSSSNPAAATVNATTGLVTGVASGTTTISVTIEGVTSTVLLTSSQAQDGSYADVIATWATEGRTLTEFCDARVNTADGVGVQTLPPVPGVTGPTYSVIESGGANVHRPHLDPTTQTLNLGAAGTAIALVSPWNGDAATDLSKGVWMAFGGAVQAVTPSVPCIGFQHAADLAAKAYFQGGFETPEHLDFWTTPDSGTHAYQYDTLYPIGLTSIDMLVLQLPPSGGADGSLNATPWITTERIGIDGQRSLPHGQTSANQFTQYPSGPCRTFFGGEPTGTQLAPVINSQPTVIYGYHIKWTGGGMTPNMRAALKRFHAARPGTTAPVSLIQHHLLGIGDSRLRGNGASNDLTTSIIPQLAAMMGPKYGGTNRGISGDNYDNIVDLALGGLTSLAIPQLLHRIGYFHDDSRAWDAILIGPQGVNSANDTVTYPPSGMTAATMLARFDLLVSLLRAIYPDPTKVWLIAEPENGQGAGEPAALAYNQGLFARELSGAIQGVSRTDTRYERQNWFDSRYSTDSLHSTDPGYAVDAQEYRRVLCARGATGVIQKLAPSQYVWGGQTIGNQITIGVTLTDDQGGVVTGYSYVWSSSNTAIATVDQTGKIIAVGSGTAFITVSTASGFIFAQINVGVN